MTIERAIAAFVRGFAFTRSLTHPYLAKQVRAGVWVLRDAPRTHGDYRCEEYVACGITASVLDRLARRQSRGQYRICVVRAEGEPDDTIRPDFRSLGYRLRGTETLMVHVLDHVRRAAEPYPVIRVTTPEQAETLAKAAGRRLVLPEHLAAGPPPIRQYMALDGQTPVGWASSVVAGACAWCSNVFVRPSYRRRGIAKSLLARMLVDDRRAGAKANVLLASHAGAKLYPVVGYETIGELLMFTPPRAARTAVPR